MAVRSCLAVSHVLTPQYPTQASYNSQFHISTVDIGKEDDSTLG